MGGYPRPVLTLSEVCYAGPDLYRSAPDGVKASWKKMSVLRSTRGRRWYPILTIAVTGGDAPLQGLSRIRGGAEHLEVGRQGYNIPLRYNSDYQL